MSRTRPRPLLGLVPFRRPVAPPRPLLAALVLSLALATAGCSSSTPAPDTAAPGDAGDAMSSTATSTPVAGTADETHGCTPGMLAFLADEAYAGVPPVDPASFSFPDGIGIDAIPTCYVYEEDGNGAARASVIFVGDPAAVLAQAADAFAAAGWTGDPTVGVWWSNGDDPVAADFSVGGVPFEIDGQPTAWFAYAF